MIHKLKLYGAILACLIGSPVLAFDIQNLPFSLNADTVSYDKNRSHLSATGNVVMRYDAYTVFSDRFEYINDKNIIEFNDNVKITKDQQSIYADTFHYDITSKKGSATQISTRVNGANLTGERIDTELGKSTIYNSEFSTCNDHRSDYTIKSKKLTIYPDSANLIAEQNTLYLLDVPLLHFSKIIHRLNNQRQNATLSPIPDVGYNQIDNTFIHFNFPYVYSPKSVGALVLGSSVERGLLYGIRNQYALSPDKWIDSSVYSIHKTGFSGGASFYWDFLANTQEDSIFSNLFKLESDRSEIESMFESHYLEDVIINNQLVSIKPELAIQVDQIRLPYELTLNSRVSGGYYSDSQASNTRYGLDLSLTRSQPINSFSTFDMSLTDQVFWYLNHENWNRLYMTVGPQFKWKQLDLSIFYTKFITKNGGSPFLFDSNYILNNDEIGLKVSTVIGQYLLSHETNYNLISHHYRVSKTGIGLNQSCWNCQLNYDSVRQNIYLSISLDI